MKRIFIIAFLNFGLLSGLILISCSDSVFPGDIEMIDWVNDIIIAEANDSHIPGTIREQYETSAKKLALQHLRNHHPEMLTIPETLTRLFYNGLIHITNDSHPKAKLVVHKMNIQAVQPANPYEILVSADTLAAAGWIDAWRMGETVTGYQELDELTSQFGYELVVYHELEAFTFSLARLRTMQLLNGYATGKLLHEIEGIRSAAPEPVFYAGFRKDIEADVYEDHVLYRFYGGNTVFRVFSNGIVQYAGELDGITAPY